MPFLLLLSILQKSTHTFCVLQLVLRSSEDLVLTDGARSTSQPASQSVCMPARTTYLLRRNVLEDRC